jgi:hypothetical protein
MAVWSIMPMQIKKASLFKMHYRCKNYSLLREGHSLLEDISYIFRCPLPQDDKENDQFLMFKQISSELVLFKKLTSPILPLQTQQTPPDQVREAESYGRFVRLQ